MEVIETEKDPLDSDIRWADGYGDNPAGEIMEPERNKSESSSF
jgi:hypothetical protein